MFLTSALFIIVTLGGLFGKSVLSQTLNDPDGLVNLRNLAKETERTAADKSIPIVFGRFYTYSRTQLTTQRSAWILWLGRTAVRCSQLLRRRN
jgi:hypothetical protein